MLTEHDLRPVRVALRERIRDHERQRRRADEDTVDDLPSLLSLFGYPPSEIPQLRNRLLVFRYTL